MCGHHGVLADFAVVGHLNQVVQLDALVDDGLSHGRAVNARIGTNLHVVLNDDDAQLWYLVVALRVGCESEAVGTDDASGMDGDVVANLATVVDDHMGIDGAAVADGDVLADAGEGADIDVLADLGGLGNEGQRVDALFLGHHLCVHLHQLGNALVGVFHTNQRAAYRMLQFQVVVHQDDTRLGVIDIGRVFGI